MISCNGVMFSGHGVATAETMVLGIVGRMLADLDDVAHAEAVAAVRASLTAHLGADGVTYPRPCGS